MANSLLNTVKENSAKLNGGLASTSQEELNTLAGAAGRAVPTSPMGASGINANPDAAKMAGTPPNMLNALRQSIQGQMSLADANRTEQARKAATSGEQASQARQQQTMGLGDLQGRVQQIADRLFTGEGKLQEQSRLVDTAKLQAALPDKTTLSQAEELVNKLGNDTASNAEILSLANMLGFTQVKDIEETKKQLKNQFLSYGAQTGGFAAGSTQNQIQFKDLNPQQLQELGFTDLGQAAQLLQLSPEELSGLTVQQIIDRVENEKSEDYSEIEKLQEILKDPARSSAEKQNALKMLREKGAVGTGAAEQGYGSLEEAVQSGDTVSFGDKDYKVEDLLADDTISGLVKDYFDNPEIAEMLKKSEPEFAAWMDQNREILEKATKEVETDVTGFGQIQQDNLDKAKTGTGVDLNDDVMSTFYDDWGSLKSDVYENNQLINTLKDTSISDAFRSTLAAGTNQLANLDKAIVADLGNTSYQEMAQAGLTSNSGVTNYVNYVQKVKDIQKLPEDQAIERAFDGMARADIDSLLYEGNLIATSGLAGRVDSAILPLLDADSDGRIDNVASVKQRILAYYTNNKNDALTVKEMANGPFKADSIPNLRQAASEYKSNTDKASELYNKVRKFISNDGQLTANEVAEATQGMSLEETDKLFRDLRLKDQGATNELDYARDRMSKDRANSGIAGTGINVDNYGSFVDKGSKGELGDGDIEKLSQAATRIGQLVNDPRYQLAYTGSYLQRMGDGIGKALAEQAKIAAMRAAAAADEAERDRQARQVANLAKAIKYLTPIAGGVAIGMDAYRELDKFLGEKVGINLPFAPGVEGINQAMDRLNTGIAKGARELASDPARLGRAVATAGLSEAVKNIPGGSTISDGISSIGGGGCFHPDTVFLMNIKYHKDSIGSRRVADIQPGDIMYEGGLVIATAQFIAKEVYEYSDKTIVNGSHAVKEDGKWVRVRDSKKATRRPDLDGMKVFVVWNENHLMISESGTVWADYAETDSTVKEIEEMRNIDELNAR